jgi:hypothetical protein
VEQETEFVRFTEGALANPGAFHWRKPLSRSPQRPQYPGKIVILVDQSLMTQAEYTSMASRGILCDKSPRDMHASACAISLVG